MKNYFAGYYFKHQNEKNTVVFIPGGSGSGAFIQVITDNKSYYHDGFGNCRFCEKGAVIDIGNIKGRIRYGKFAPVKYDIMGPFKYFPMECRHGIVSMRHTLNGWLSIDGEVIDFTGGIGYIEKDSGVSFPRSYLWMQCNFAQNCSVFVSVADIPFMGFRFKGCICVVYYKGREYRLATYLGVKILRCNRERVVLRQGRYLLIADILPREGQCLAAPRNGRMNRLITECLACPVRVRFYIGGRKLFDLRSERGSFEYAFEGIPAKMI